ncbi:hypothetical protein B0H16DRAFT_1465176 [Mycena metata]|uniref:DUF6534 domain-containing protein n=1 Tax=Mycena metata TaxID=1033252 RepID=A0AAD7N0Z0_9AGAR|nr:hypothetical protein B0H16DRAFT_1465176 [Mycena metata]
MAKVFTVIGSLQLFANYLSAFTVQIFFATRIYLRTRVLFGEPIVVVLLALVQLSAGTAQTYLTYKHRSFSKLDETTIPISLPSISPKTGSGSTERLLNSLIIHAVNRGFVTAITSTFTMVLFVVYPHSFWFFLSIAPSSKLYMNSMLATLNMRGHIWRNAHSVNENWENVNLGQDQQ